MNLKRTIRYQWLKFKRLQGDPKKLAWGMVLGVFVGITPTVPFHTITVLILAPLLRVSPVTAYLGIWVGNPLAMGPLYLLAYKVGKFCLHAAGKPLVMPEVYDFHSLMQLLWKGGLALQLGGIIIAIPPAIVSYFLTLWVVQRYRNRRALRAASVPAVSPSHPAATRPEA
jgi:uncharacterized protein (TIGR03546 family)